MKRNLNRSYLTILALCLFLISYSISFAMMSEKGEAGITERVEKAILKASEMYEQGKIKKGKPYTVEVSMEIGKKSSEETFDKDVDNAFKTLDRLMKEKTGKKEAVAVPVPENDRIGALKQAEKRMDKGSPHPAGDKMSSEYSVYKNYQQLRQERMSNENKVAEADMQAVIAERQAAAQDLQRKREREQQLQAQAMKWQEQMDKQASASASAAAQWEAEHSFGAYAKKFLGVVVQTAVGSFTGGFLGTLSTNFANHAVKKLFPNVDTSTLSQAAAAGTSSAITGTAGSVGQTATSSVTGSITGQGQQQSQGTQPQY
ncbi:MAG: hypothetical protein HZA09_04535 [Nitrospirae bacterium]|nr:hypothetical protein [Nitrospirota bacterium]